jgi:hypothetical protein
MRLWRDPGEGQHQPRHKSDAISNGHRTHYCSPGDGRIPVRHTAQGTSFTEGTAILRNGGRGQGEGNKECSTFPIHGGTPCSCNTPHILIPTRVRRNESRKNIVIDRYLPMHTLRSGFLGVPRGGVLFSGVITVLERATKWRAVRQRETKRTEWPSA